jgi:uncharacterized membrane protein (UPF0127 family)
MTNAERRQLLDRHRASGFTGSIVDVLSAARQGIDLIGQFEQQNDIQVANTPEEQQSGLRPAHQAGDINQSMVFSDVPPNTNFNTMGMKAPINIQKFDTQGHLVKSYENVPPGIQSLPTGPQRGTVIETPARMQSGGPTLTREYLEKYLSKNRGGTPESWSAAADTIAFHESGWRDRMSPLAMQEKDGPGRGMFQFETTHSESFTTAQNRHKNIANITGTTPDPEIMKATSAEQLPVDKQYALFYSHLIEEPKAPLAKYPAGEMPLVDMWLKGHKKKEKSGDRAAFEASRQAAKKEGIPRGVGYQRGGFLRRPPRTLSRKKRAQ